MVKIAPSIISADFTNLENEVNRLEKAGPDLFHLDVMDGHFVPNLTFGPFIVQAIRKITSLPLDIHLMMENPNGYLQRFAEAGADSLTIHVELEDEADIGIKKIKDLGIKVGLAINPETPAEKIRPFFNQIDILNVMTVNPGFSGQMFIQSCIPKIQILKKWIDEEGRSIQIEVDGGINMKTAASVLEAGAEILVTGSALFTASNTRQFIKDLRSAGQNNSNP
jgi:ribulose-phosphate 3-epimerase